MRRESRGVAPAFAFATLLLTPFSASAQISLGTAQSFAALGGQTVTNTGPSIINGNVGVSPGSAITGFPPGIIVGGAQHAANAVAATAQADLIIAYDAVSTAPCTVDLTGQDLGSLPAALPPGVYCFTSTAFLTGTLRLDFQGNPNSLFIFKIGTGLTTAVKIRWSCLSIPAVPYALPMSSGGSGARRSCLRIPRSSATFWR